MRATDHAPGLERAFADEPVEGELGVLAVEGELPRALAGTFYLNGPARFAAGATRYRNWLDGDGMVLAVDFAEGRVRARQRFVRTAKLVEERRMGRALYRTFGTRFPGDRLVHGMAVASPVNLSAYPVAGRLLAFGEQGAPWELDPTTLETLGPGTFGGTVTAATPFSGHPKPDPHTGELVTFGVAFTPQAPALHLFRFAPDRTLALRARHAIPYPASIHDFALAARHAVFHVAPHLLDLGALREGATVMEALSWRPELGSRLVVLSREDGRCVAEVAVERPAAGPGGNAGGAHAAPYCLHLLNAWEDGERLVVDLVELDRPIYQDYDGLPDLFVESPLGRTVRYEVDLAAGRLAGRTASPDLGTPDFPTLDRRLATRRADEGWLLRLGHAGEPGRKFFDRLVHVRWDEGRAAGEWVPPAGTLMAGEPAFAPLAGGGTDGGDARRDAVLLAPIWEPARNRSGLALLDPHDVGAGPRVTVWFATRVRLGFHSFWAAAAARDT